MYGYRLFDRVACPNGVEILPISRIDETGIQLIPGWTRIEWKQGSHLRERRKRIPQYQRRNIVLIGKRKKPATLYGDGLLVHWVLDNGQPAKIETYLYSATKHGFGTET